MFGLRCYSITGVKKDIINGKQVYTVYTCYLLTKEDLNYALNILKDGHKGSALANEIGVPVQDFFDPLKWRVEENPPHFVIDVANSSGFKEMMEENLGVVPIVVQVNEGVAYH